MCNVIMWIFRSALKYTLASFPGPFEKLERRTWYLLFARVLNFPTFRELWIIPCCLCVTWRQVRVYCLIFNRTLLTLAICVEDLEAAVVCLPATSRGNNGDKTQKESIYGAFILASYGFWQVIICVVSRSQTLTRKAGESLVTLTYWVDANRPQNFCGQ